MHSREKPTFVDLFSGCGGLSLGFINAGFRGLLAVDIDPHAVKVYNNNLKGPDDTGAVLADLSRLTSKEKVLKFLGDFNISPGDVDVLVGGPPCQSYSVVGRNKIRALMESSGDLEQYWREKDNMRASLFEVFALFIEVLEPVGFLFENVPSIQSHKAFQKLMNRFTNLQSLDGTTIQYEIYPGKYWASDYGVPQKRRRFVMIGTRRGTRERVWIQPGKVQEITVEQAIGDLPEIQHGHKQRRLQYSASSLTNYQMLMRRDIPAEEGGYVYDHICRWHNPDDVELFRRMRPGARFADPDVQLAIREINPQHKLLKYATDKFKDKLHKLDPNRPAWTVTAHLKKDGYKFIHYQQPRTISVREAARLQSFPDWFVFTSVSMVRAFGLIGNAVPPMMAEAFARSLYSFVNGEYN